MSLVGRRAENHPQQVAVRGALDRVDDRRTPAAIFDPLNKEFGFTLDVAASDENAKCARYYTLKDDGLREPWDGRVWCNPPYSDCGAWTSRAHAEYEHQFGPFVLLLPANRTEQGWWQRDVELFRKDRGGHLEVRFLPGRPRFDVPAGTYSDPRGNRPPFGVCVVIWP